MVHVLGLDLSKRRGAIVAFTDGSYLTHYKFGINKLEDAYQNTEWFLEDLGLDSTVDRFAYVEAPVVGRGGAKVTIDQSFVSGVVQLCLGRHGWAVDLVNVQSWKKHVVGAGNSSKDQVADWVDLNHGAVARGFGGDQDLYDAFCVGLYGVPLHSSS